MDPRYAPVWILANIGPTDTHDTQYCSIEEE